ncbi:MAG: GNAT family N-acetyltransferase [Ornithinimicrobium sp.]
MSIESVDNNAAASRFEISSDGEVVGYLDYRTHGNTIDLTHAHTEPAMRGQGLAGQLVQGALDVIKVEKMHVIATCPYVASWIEDHPEYQDLLDPH